MAIVNRDKDSSEQVEVITLNRAAVGISAAITCLVAPYPCVVQKVAGSFVGLSGSPVYTFERLTLGSSGLAMGISGLVAQAVGTSGPQNFSGLAASGSTLLSLAKGDRVQVISSGANTAVAEFTLQLVIKKSQDIVSYF